MISFRHKGTTKRIKIKTNKRLDDRMSHWLRTVFGFRGQIIGFKSAENIYYDVDTFYATAQKFFGTQVEIVEAGDQIEISFTSDNLNSSSFIRPSQPNTSEINPRDQEELIVVSDAKNLERRLQQGRELSILFCVASQNKRQLTNGISELISALGHLPSSSSVGPKISFYMHLHTAKDSLLIIYVGRNSLVTVPLSSNYKNTLKEVIGRWRKGNGEKQKYMKAQEDQAPSFTTYHLQQRLNQQACAEYLQRMHREKVLKNYQFYKLSQKLQNFIEFYQLFCQGVIDNDYESFKTEILHKVQNNLQLILSNVDEMDLSRPISREEQRKQNLKKSPDISIVKVQNYFEILDLFKNLIEPSLLAIIKQQLIDYNEQFCKCFAQYLARDCSQNQIVNKLIALAKLQREDLRPLSRCLPRSVIRTRSVDNKVYAQQDNMQSEGVQPPMFGSLPKENSFSPIRQMSDIQGKYNILWDKLANSCEHFSADEYGLLYLYLQNRDYAIVWLLDENELHSGDCIERLRKFLAAKMQTIMKENFSQAELNTLQGLRETQAIACVYENFRYESNIETFLSSLKEQLSKAKPILEQRILHKKSSDSQLLGQTKGSYIPQRKYSDEVQDVGGMSSPKQSEYSQRESGVTFFREIRQPWLSEFEEMLGSCGWLEKGKQDCLRSAFLAGNPSLFLTVRDYLKHKNTKAQYAYSGEVELKETEIQVVSKLIPFLSALLFELEREGLIDSPVRKWALLQVIELNPGLLSAFESYLQLSNIIRYAEDEDAFVKAILKLYRNESDERAIDRIEKILREMSVHDKIGYEAFECHNAKIKAIVELYLVTGDVEDMMENLELLYVEHAKSRKISFATLNFSGINTSPFEYDDGSEMFARLNANFKEMLTQQKAEMKEWKMGKIDKIYQSHRQSVSFDDLLELFNGKLPNREQFAQIWRRKWEEFNLKAKVNTQPTQAEISEAIDLDFMVYRAVAKQIYHLQNPIDPKLSSEDGQLLNDFLTKIKNRPSCQLQAKQDLVVSYLKKSSVDVLCLQQAGAVQWSNCLPTEQYSFLQQHDSVIIYRHSRIGNPKQTLIDKYRQIFDFNKDSAVLLTDKDYLIISGHLKSNDLHIKQAEEMFKTLETFTEEHPLWKIMIGMDANHFIPNEHALFDIAPNVDSVPTSVKKRTYLQAQLKKSGELVSSVKDHLLCNGKILEHAIENIGGKQSQSELLPNDDHPYDHFIVRGILFC